MKPLRTGLGLGLLAGAAGAVTKLVGDRRAGTLGRDTGPVKVAPAVGSKVSIGAGAGGRPDSAATGKVAPKADAKGSFVARRAARRAEANRPAWVVAPAAGGGSHPSAPPRPAPAMPRKPPPVAPRKPVSAKSVGATMGKYAVKRAGKVIGNVAAERVGKAIEVIEVLEKVIASATESTPAHDMTPAGPGAATVDSPAAILVPIPPARATPAPSPEPRGTLVSVRKRERGPRVVVGPSVTPPAPEAPPATAPVEDAVGAPVVEDAVEEALEAAADAAAPVDTPVTAKRARTSAKKSASTRAAPKAPAAKKEPRPAPAATDTATTDTAATAEGEGGPVPPVNDGP